MKRLLPFIISILFVISLSLAGCSEVDRSGELREFLSANEDAFSEVFTEESCGFSAFTEYINNWSLALDFKILLKTVKTVINKDGAM